MKTAFSLSMCFAAGTALVSESSTAGQPTADTYDGTFPAGDGKPILTPPVPPTPRINGAKVFGVRPGKPMLFKVAASGIAPLTFTAQGLPPG